METTPDGFAHLPTANAERKKQQHETLKKIVVRFTPKPK
jgi:hypothetical protein